MTTKDDVASARKLLKAELKEEIGRLITVGATEGALIAAVAYLAGQFPDMIGRYARQEDALAVAVSHIGHRPIWGMQHERGSNRHVHPLDPPG